MKRIAKTYLEIGAGERAAAHLMPRMKKGDGYLTVDMRPLERRVRSNIKGVKNLPLSADAFELPVRDKSIDHVVSANVISELWFPHVYALHVPSFRVALEKLEAEIHRVTKERATITFHEQYTPGVLDYKEGELGAEEANLSRLEHLKQVFGRRWLIRIRNIPKRLDGTRGSGVLIKLFKK